jgi:ribose transport system substrate-binding protein
MMPRTSALLGLTCFGLLAVAGSAMAQDVSVAVLTKNLTNPFFQSVRVGAEKAAKAANAKVLNYVPTKPDSIPEQLSQIDDIVVRKPSAVLFTPVDSKAMAPGLEDLNRAGIPVILLSERISDGKYAGFVGAADYNIALETARYLLKSIGGKGNIVILEGVRGSQTSTDRIRGFNDALKEFKDAKLVASQPANYQRLQALQVMENLLQSQSQIDGILAANDGMAVGAIEALEGANRKAAIVGINGSKEAVDAILQGKLLASGDYNGFLQGCVGMMMAMRHLAKQPVPQEFLLKPIVVNKSNTKGYELPVEERSCPTWEAVEADLKTN